MALITIQSDGDPYPALAGNPLTNVNTRQFTSGGIIDQDYTLTFNYRGGTNSINPHLVPVGAIGVALNGVLIYSPRHPGKLPGVAAALLPESGFEWDAVFSSSSFGADLCGGATESGKYFYRSGLFLNAGWMGNSVLYEANPYFNDTTFGTDHFRHPDGHSKILGFMFDGFPIYGPYAYENPNATVDDVGNAVTQMLSSYRKKTVIAPGRPYTYTQYSAGKFIQDYEYISTLSTLDEFNGRFCNTPDFKTGTYAYFLTFENGTLNVPAYPYIAGVSTREQRPGIVT